MDKDTIEYIINVLRQGTITWAGRNECLNRNRYLVCVGRYKNGKEKSIWYRNCDNCGKGFALKDNSLEVDHIKEIGPFEGDFNSFIARMYCGQDNLQALCFSCHSEKTAIFNATLRYIRKEAVNDSIDYL